MLAQEANKTKIEIFNIISENIQKKIMESSDMYNQLSQYNNLITYEELYDLTEEDIEKFHEIRDRAHEFEHELIHIKEDLIKNMVLDIEWVLTNNENKQAKQQLDNLRKSDIFYDFFNLEIILGLIFDKLKQLNVPRKKCSHQHLYSHKSGGCC